jgi:hypothetical protein
VRGRMTLTRVAATSTSFACNSCSPLLLQDLCIRTLLSSKACLMQMESRDVELVNDKEPRVLFSFFSEYSWNGLLAGTLSQRCCARYSASLQAILIVEEYGLSNKSHGTCKRDKLYNMFGSQLKMQQEMITWRSWLSSPRDPESCALVRSAEPESLPLRLADNWEYDC